MIKATLTDIEGATSSLSFVKDVLFPYSRARRVQAVRAQLDEVGRAHAFRRGGRRAALARIDGT